MNFSRFSSIKFKSILLTLLKNIKDIFDSIVNSIHSVGIRFITKFPQYIQKLLGIKYLSTLSDNYEYVYRFKKKPIISFERVEHYLLFNQFLSNIYHLLNDKYKLNLSLIKDPNFQRMNAIPQYYSNPDFSYYWYIEDIIGKKLKKYFGYDQGYFFYDYLFLFREESLANGLKSIQNELNSEIGTPFNIPVWGFIDFLLSRNLENNDENRFKRSSVFDLDHFFSSQEDLDVLIVLLEHLILEMNYFEWKASLKDIMPMYFDEPYTSLSFYDVKFDLIRFIRILKSLSLPYYNNKNKFNHFKQLYYLKYRLLKIRMIGLVKFNRVYSRFYGRLNN